MTRFTDYELVRAQRELVLVWKHELVDSAGTLLATTERADVSGAVILWGAELRPLAFQNDRVSQRTAALTVPVSDPLLVPDRQGTLLHPDTGNRVRVSAGIMLDGAALYWVQATLTPDRVTASIEEGVTVIVVDLVDMTRPVQSELVGAFLFTDGEAVETVVGRLMADVFPGGGYSIAATGFVTPAGSAEAGERRSKLIGELLDGVGHELTTDEYGLVFTRAVLPTTDTGGERWRYGQADGIPFASAVREWTVKTPQAWRIEGGSFQNSENPVTLTVYDTDPTSEGFFDGRTPAQVRTSRLPWVKSTVQAAAAGYAQLRRYGVGPMVLTFTTLPNPAMREGDLLEVELDELNATGVYRVLDYDLPIQVDGLMRVRARQVYDPAVNYVPVGMGDGCLISFADDFNRPDQNLEHCDPGEAGSEDWIEHGWSWGVVGGRAIQRYADGWSLALVRTPLCATNQQVSIDVAALPSGRLLGPFLRSTGQFDGYGALVDSGGKVTLELWLNGSRMAVLGEYQSGGSPVGKTLTIRASGPALSVVLDGDTVITGNDDRCVGAHVGMLGYGGWTGSSPAADNFSATAI